MANRNVIVLMTDQQRFDLMGIYGLTSCRTPNLGKTNEGQI